MAASSPLGLFLSLLRLRHLLWGEKVDLKLAAREVFVIVLSRDASSGEDTVAKVIERDVILAILAVGCREASRFVRCVHGIRGQGKGPLELGSSFRIVAEGSLGVSWEVSLRFPS